MPSWSTVKNTTKRSVTAFTGLGLPIAYGFVGTITSTVLFDKLAADLLTMADQDPEEFEPYLWWASFSLCTIINFVDIVGHALQYSRDDNFLPNRFIMASYKLRYFISLTSSICTTLDMASIPNAVFHLSKSDPGKIIVYSSTVVATVLGAGFSIPEGRLTYSSIVDLYEQVNGVTVAEKKSLISHGNSNVKNWLSDSFSGLTDVGLSTFYALLGAITSSNLTDKIIRLILQSLGADSNNFEPYIWWAAFVFCSTLNAVDVLGYVLIFSRDHNFLPKNFISACYRMRHLISVTSSCCTTFDVASIPKAIADLVGKNISDTTLLVTTLIAWLGAIPLSIPQGRLVNASIIDLKEQVSRGAVVEGMSVGKVDVEAGSVRAFASAAFVASTQRYTPGVFPREVTLEMRELRMEISPEAEASRLRYMQ